MSPLGSSVLGAENAFVQRKRFLFSPGWPSLSPRNMTWLVSHELDFSTHLLLGLMLIYPAQMHNFPSSSSAFPPCLICCTYIYLSVFHLNTPSVLHLRSYAFAAPFVREISFPTYSHNSFGLCANITSQRSLWLSYIKITHHYYLLPYAATLFCFILITTIYLILGIRNASNFGGGDILILFHVWGHSSASSFFLLNWS